MQELDRGPSYTIAGKPAAEGAEAAPGPGEYEERRTAVGAGVAVTIGQRLDAAAPAAETPGPAEYQVAAVGTGAAFTMAGKPAIRGCGTRLLIIPRMR